MKIEYFREFTILAEYLNYTAAAEHLYITQPVLSRHIAALEEHLGAALLIRNTQSVELTEVGKIFLEKITAILADYDNLCARIRLAKLGFSDCLRIGVPYYALNDYLGHAPEIFESTYPDVKLLYSVGDPNEILHNLLMDKVDIALLANRNFPSAENFEFHALYEEPLGVLINRNDPLAAQTSCSLTDLKDKLFFSIDNFYFAELWQQIKNLCQNAGFEPQGPAMLNQAEAALIAVRRGDGVIIHGRHMRRHASDEIAFLDLTDKGCSRTVSILCRKKNASGLVRKFIKLFSK
ncbi:MAG: LysR family transcriptional regulator [Clostridiales Family XIII bacterium]|nr:LysR family transcriptional regulator [Clostridiales Family XIII bacterium]